MSYDFSAQRLYIETPLGGDISYGCTREQANYLLNVLRLKNSAQILVFNGRDGEWLAEIENSSRRACTLRITKQTRPQCEGPDIHYLFAPLKRARLDYMVQKVTELGVVLLQPVMTRRTQTNRVNLDRLQANIIEAAEQCGILHIPQVKEPEKLMALLDNWPKERHLIYCDENAEIASPIEALSNIPRGPLAVLIGPEGGFDAQEQEILHKRSFVTAISLGPRIMRADTAAVAALTLVNAVLGDWDDKSDV